ncbi:MAG: DUF3530 family protein [Gammaproteobacteria bacterium]|nr:DUF3530 family protein [Gammaproteobacteria bacterium]
MSKINILIFLGLFSTLGITCHASDSEKEQRWESQIVGSLAVGEPVKLKTDKGEFLALYTPSSKSVQGAAIILHGMGAHPAWPEVVEPLRTQLPDHGWHTLSLQMPILANAAAAEDYIPLLNEVAPRINAGVAYLKQKGIKHIVIIAHSLGAAMASSYLADKPDPLIHAFVGIGMGKIEGDPRLDNAVALSKIKLPVLDLYGSQDLAPVLDNAKARADAAAKAGNKHYTQFSVAGADHFFTQMDDELVKRVRGWLSKHAAGK